MDREKNRKDLEARLNEVGLTLEIYEKKPPKYVRVRVGTPRKEWEKTGLAGVFRSRDPTIGQSGAYLRGDFEIMDLASYLPVLALKLEKGQSLLDMCAAPGGKALAAWDLFQAKLICVEKNRKRFSQMKTRFEQNRVPAECVLGDAVRVGGEWERILLDAPCSGEGIVTRFDDVLEKTENQIRRLAKRQFRMLKRAYHILAPGGTLVYATCALNTRENEGVVEKFLWKEQEAILEVPEPLGDVDTQKTRFGMRVVPGKTRGLFAARIKKP